MGAGHTGYAQTLEEVTKDGNGVETKRIVYTIGHDQISQTVYEGTDPPVTHTLHADGHGSTRVLTDAVAAILQHYAYDAHGNVLGFDPATALTSYLYSGEHFDARIGQQYLRARWYDATTGRFNRLDPFFGNLNDPQSLHKYLYVHGDPVNGVDPSGMFLSSVNVSMVIQAGLATVNVLSGTANVYHGWQRTVDGLTLLKRTPPDLIGSAINFALATFHYGLAIWDFSSALSGLKKPPAGSAGGLVAASVGRVSGRSIITILAENPALGRYILEHLAPAVAGSMGHFIGIATPRPQSLDAFTFASSANDPRDQPGTASGGTNLPAVKGKWLEGGVAGYVPPQVANQLRGRSFDNWRHFREEFWRAVAKVPHLRDQFNAGNGKLMEGGTAPKAPPDLQWKSRDQYILHHIEDLQYGGSLYDLDNLLILAPKTHNGIHNVPFGTP